MSKVSFLWGIWIFISDVAIYILARKFRLNLWVVDRIEYGIFFAMYSVIWVAIGHFRPKFGA